MASDLKGTLGSRCTSDLYIVSALVCSGSAKRPSELIIGGVRVIAAISIITVYSCVLAVSSERYRMTNLNATFLTLSQSVQTLHSGFVNYIPSVHGLLLT